MRTDINLGVATKYLIDAFEDRDEQMIDDIVARIPQNQKSKFFADVIRYAIDDGMVNVIDGIVNRVVSNNIVFEQDWLDNFLFSSIISTRSNPWIVNKIIDLGANVDVGNLLAIALSDGKFDVAEILINRGVDIGKVDNEGRSALHTAVKIGSNYFVRKLLEKGADVNVKDNDGDSALHLACKVGRKDVVETLLENGARIDEPNNKKHTPLHIASNIGRESAVRALLKRNANLDVIDGDQAKAIHHALGLKQYPVLFQIVKKSYNQALASGQEFVLDGNLGNGQRQLIGRIVGLLKHNFSSDNQFANVFKKVVDNDFDFANLNYDEVRLLKEKSDNVSNKDEKFGLAEGAEVESLTRGFREFLRTFKSQIDNKYQLEESRKYVLDENNNDELTQILREYCNLKLDQKLQPKELQKIYQAYLKDHHSIAELPTNPQEAGFDVRDVGRTDWLDTPEKVKPFLEFAIGDIESRLIKEYGHRALRDKILTPLGLPEDLAELIAKHLSERDLKNVSQVRKAVSYDSETSAVQSSVQDDDVHFQGVDGRRGVKRPVAEEVGDGRGAKRPRE